MEIDRLHLKSPGQEQPNENMESSDIWRESRNQQLLSPLRESIVDKPPYIIGTLQLPHSFFSLFYKVTRDGHAARHIDFANATSDELKQLAQACEVDEADHNSGKMDTECFSSTLDPFRTDLIKIIRGYPLEGKESVKKMKLEPHKLNVYSKGSSSKPHIDPPRSKNMFGSLVFVFPTYHEGGALFLRHRGHECILDPGQVLAGGCLDRPSIGYMAFLNDVEQEVSPVTSGHCVTLTYNFYFDEDGGPVSEKDGVSEHFTPPKLPNQDGFREAFEALLENPEFMADGGMLAFGLRHDYHDVIDYNWRAIYNVLKGSDTVLFQGVRALGFEPVLHMYYFDWNYYEEYDPSVGVIIDDVVRFHGVFEEYSCCEVVLAKGGIRVYQDDEGGYSENSEPIEWVTPKTGHNRQEGIFVSTDDPTKQIMAYGDPCMIVRIGKAGDRLAYPTVAQVKKAHKKSRLPRQFRNRRLLLVTR